MISLQQVLIIHDKLIAEFGGLTGVRELALLESAIARPYQKFNAQDLYSTPILKAAAVLQSLLINHPFVDGNKRTAYTVARITLLQNSMEFCATEDEKYEFIVSIASGKMDFEEIVDWLKSHTSTLQ